jgi:uncharacterized membrane protein YeaQ/YmgE (transglycosylase-associated protein family)
MWNLIGMVFVGAIVGYAAGLLYKGKGFGFWKNVIIGIIGSFIGGFLLRLIGFSATGIIASLISDLLGALALLWLINWYAGKK